jgi:hypothetical protein
MGIHLTKFRFGKVGSAVLAGGYKRYLTLNTENDANGNDSLFGSNGDAKL